MTKPAPYLSLTGELETKRWIWTHRVLPNLIKSGDCLEWHKSNTKGYGHVRFSVNDVKRCVSTHRIAWEVANNRLIPDGLSGLHRCDNPKCNNPDHIFIGTQRDNARDTVAKGRARGLFQKGHTNGPNQIRGNQFPHAKMTDETVREARAIYDSKQMGHKRLAKKYGVAIRTMNLVVRRLSWRHVP